MYVALFIVLLTIAVILYTICNATKDSNNTDRGSYIRDNR